MNYFLPCRGFGVDNVTNTWSITAGLTYNISRHIDLGLAYRVLKINVVKSTNVAFNTLMYGPELGVIFRY
jgi:opacity protein-like surface antigen